MLDLRRLRLLRELEARGTIHAAARALDYTPSAISQQLAVLEREAGAPLLERTGRTLRLTDAGRLLVEHAGALLDRMEAAEAELAALVAGRPAGTVRIASFQTAFLQLVAPAVARLAGEHPEVREEQVRVLLPARHPLAGRDRVALDRLAAAVWVGARSSAGHREMHLRVCRERGGFEPDIRFHSDDLAIQLEMVRTTRACGLLPDLVLGGGVPGIAAPLVAGGGIGREVFTVTRRASTPSIAVVRAALSPDRPIQAQPG